MMVGESISAIVLAAGLSQRAAPHHKLLLERQGRPVIRSVLEAVCDAGLKEVLVVLGHKRELVEAALEGLPIRFVFATDYALGMGHSLASGVRAARADASGFLITVGDLPDLKPADVRTVAVQFILSEVRKHIIPVHKGQPGHPVVLGAWLRPLLENLRGDKGAKDILNTPAERGRIRYLEMTSSAVVTDLDQANEAP